MSSEAREHSESITVVPLEQFYSGSQYLVVASGEESLAARVDVRVDHQAGTTRADVPQLFSGFNRLPVRSEPVNAWVDAAGAKWEFADPKGLRPVGTIALEFAPELKTEVSRTMVAKAVGSYALQTVHDPTADNRMLEEIMASGLVVTRFDLRVTPYATSC